MHIKFFSVLLSLQACELLYLLYLLYFHSIAFNLVKYTHIYAQPLYDENNPFALSLS